MFLGVQQRSPVNTELEPSADSLDEPRKVIDFAQGDAREHVLTAILALNTAKIFTANQVAYGSPQRTCLE